MTDNPNQHLNNNNYFHDINALNELNIVSINVNSLVRQQRRFYLQQIIDKNNIDIALVCETKLNQKHKINFNNFDLIRRDGKNLKFSGGTGMIIRRDIKYEIVNYPNSLNNAIIEYTIIKITTINLKGLYIISIYATSADQKKQTFLDELNTLFDDLKLCDAINFI